MYRFTNSCTLNSTPIYHIVPPNAPPLQSTPLHRLTTLPIPTYSSPVSQHPQTGDDEDTIPFIPGGGLTRRILSSLPQQWPTPTAAILHFVVEGDNQADAAVLASAVAHVLGLEQSVKEWVQPGSWKQGLFGTPHDQTLYG